MAACTRIFIAAIALTALGATAALAQNPQPYAGLQQRAVKSLSEQQIADLRAGRGMGLALPAELNGYPGPAHVLENADALGLSTDQRERTKALFEAMKTEALPAGERLIEQETKLDRLFANREISLPSLSAVTEEIALTQARLRQTHLKYHLAMMNVLSSNQVERYRDLRGYGNEGDSGQHHPMHH